MKANQYDNVCARTEHKEERVRVRNIKNGQIGYTFGCTMAGETVQVQLENGELDSWVKDECEEVM